MEVTGDGALAPDGRKGSMQGVERAVHAEEDREHFDRSRVEMVRAYAEHGTLPARVPPGATSGRRSIPPCGNCDNCDAGPWRARAARGRRVRRRRPCPATASGATVRCSRWKDDQLTVVFDSVGYKALLGEDVADRGLLERA